MKKIVPDPPLTLNPTTEQSFCSCQSSHPPIFTVRPGVDAADALVHASMLARAIQEIADDYAQHHAPEAGRAMIWSILHSAETVRARRDGGLRTSAWLPAVHLAAEDDRRGGLLHSVEAADQVEQLVQLLR